MAEKILIISPVPLFPEHAGNRERIRTICMELMSRGYTLDFFYAGFDEALNEKHTFFFNGDILQHHLESSKVNGFKNPAQRIIEIANGFKHKAHKWFRYFVDGAESARFNKSLYQYINVNKLNLLKRQLPDKSYKAVIVNYAPYSFYFDVFEEEIIRIIDTHDRLTDRYKLFSENNQPPIDWHSLRYNDEKRALSKADIIWAITEEEKKHFRGMIDENSSKVFVLTHLMKYDKTEAEGASKNIIMIGSGNRLNLEGLDWFMEQVWQKLKHYDKEIEFLIAGSICNVLEDYVIDDRVQLLGLFNSPEEVYSKGEIFINPMQSGTGLKIKTFEALVHGKFVMSTNAGATGLDQLVDNGLACSDNPAEWIRQIKSFFENPAAKKRELENAKKIITKMYHRNLEIISLSLGVYEKDVDQ